MEMIYAPPLTINRFEGFPSTSEGFSEIESKNVPAVFEGCIKQWNAFSKWNPSTGGLDYLQEVAGSSTVEAMLSRCAPIFYGDIRSHERVPLSFSAFITFCKSSLKNKCDVTGICMESESCGTAEIDSDEAVLISMDARQIYLAQVPISNAESRGMAPLEALKCDIQMPVFLETKSLASINLWMSNVRSKSSTHYDPHNNLLCIVSGCKQVILWPPSASTFLYPMPIYGEASNHSSVDMENPDLSIHPRAKQLLDYSQKIVLHAGDAIYIPEGWFHQVDSEDLTIAVNFWWQSNTMSRLLEHMDAYYLRILLRRLVDKETNKMLHPVSFRNTEVRFEEDTYDQQSNGVAGQTCIMDSNVSNHGQTSLQFLEPNALQVLHRLVSLVHEFVDESKSNPLTSMGGIEDGLDKKGVSSIYQLEDDPVARIFWNLEPLLLRKIFLAMVQSFPRTLEALILHVLTSVGAEVLTRKFEEMDQQTTNKEQKEFYQLFYSVFENQSAAMETILKGKESFAAQAFRNVLEQYLAIDSNRLA